MTSSSSYHFPDSPVVITGCAGFIGFSVARVFLQKGFTVVGLDNLDPFYSIRLKQERLQVLESLARTQGGSFYFWKEDVGDVRILDRVFGEFRPHAVIHLAARANVRLSLRDPRSHYRVNLDAFMTLLQKMAEYRIPYLVLASTSSVYAAYPPPFSEELPIRWVRSPYAGSKLAAEHYLQMWMMLHPDSLQACILRYFTVYGPWGRPDMLIYILLHNLLRSQPTPIYGDGSQTRSFTYVEDIAKGTFQAYASLVQGRLPVHQGLPEGPAPIMNLGNSQVISLRELFQIVEEVTGHHLLLQYEEFHPADLRATAAVIERARQWMGWLPQTPIEEGVRLTWEWFQKHQDWVLREAPPIMGEDV